MRGLIDREKEPAGIAPPLTRRPNWVACDTDVKIAALLAARPPLTRAIKLDWLCEPVRASCPKLLRNVKPMQKTPCPNLLSSSLVGVGIACMMFLVNLLGHGYAATSDPRSETLGAAEADAAAATVGAAAVETEHTRKRAGIPAAASDERIARPITLSVRTPAHTFFL